MSAPKDNSLLVLYEPTEQEATAWPFLMAGGVLRSGRHPAFIQLCDIFNSYRTLLDEIPKEQERLEVLKLRKEGFEAWGKTCNKEDNDKNDKEMETLMTTLSKYYATVISHKKFLDSIPKGSVGFGTKIF